MRRLLIGCLLLTACGDPRPVVTQGESRVESGVPCRPAPAVDEPLPEGFPAPPPGAVLVEVTPAQASGRVIGEVEDVLVHFRSAVDRAGYVVTREEDEGRSAQLGFFGARGEGTVTIAALSCPPTSTGFTVRVARSTS